MAYYWCPHFDKELLELNHYKNNFLKISENNN